MQSGISTEEFSQAQFENYSSQLTKELRESLDYIDQWIEPSDELFDKLQAWSVLKLQFFSAEPIDLESTSATTEVNDVDLQRSHDLEFLEFLYRFHKEVRKAWTKIEKLIIVQREISNANGPYNRNFFDHIERYHEKLIYLLNEKEGVLLKDLRQLGRQEDVEVILEQIQSPDTKPESIEDLTSLLFRKELSQAYTRVSQLFEDKGRAFWSGSLSDFVFAIDALALKGYLKREELEEGLAETFGHKPIGKAKVQKLTANKIKDRRRALKSSSTPHKASTEITNTMKDILDGMPSNSKES